MGILLDTHTLVWTAQGSPRLGREARALMDGGAPLSISAVTAWEYVDLQHRGRLPQVADFAEIRAKLEAEIVDLPAHLWTVAASLPNIHGDPVDRMLIAHALIGDFMLVTVDAKIRRYPIRTIW